MLKKAAPPPPKRDDSEVEELDKEEPAKKSMKANLLSESFKSKFL